jgi:glutamyl-Q tRNA(Asp) synthetase
MTVVTRTAPSPTGRLHLGHAYSALFAFEAARAADGRFLLRIEDIDAARCRPEFEQGILEDLAWLGLAWEAPVRRQSEHLDEYAAAVERLRADGLVYPCFCTRAEIAQATSAPHGAPQGPDGPVYSGTCRALSNGERQRRLESGTAYALRLDMVAARARSGTLEWRDRARGTVTATPEIFGDVVIARKDTPTSYHLSVTLDDAVQGVTLVTRGEDLFASTHVHRLLQALLSLATPEYHHHPLVLGPDGKRLAKRANAPTLQSLRAAGHSPAEVRQMALDALGP